MTGYYEDIQIGDELVLGSYTFTPEKIVEFARKYDPQEFHLSDEGARKTHFGRLCASGWHTASAYMKVTVQKTKELAEEARKSGESAAQMGPSPGFEDLKWLKPVFAGDTVTYKRVITNKVESKSRPNWGIVQAENIGINQDGQTVFSFKSSVFLERRPKSEG